MIVLLVTAVWFLTIGIASYKVLGASPIGSALDRAAHHYLLGLAVHGMALFALGVLGAPLGAGAFIAVFAIALGIIVMGRRRTLESSRRRYPILATAILFIPFIAIAADAMWVPLRDYDGRAFWVLKAKAIVEEESIDGPFFQGQTSVNLHSQYPLLMPLNSASMLKVLNDSDDRNVRWIFALTALALCLLARAHIGDHFGAPAGAWCATVILWLPQIAVELEGGAMSAFNDIPLAAFIAAAFFSILQKSEHASRVTGLWLAALILTKNEGLMIAIVLALLAIAFRMRSSSVRKFSFWFALVGPPTAATALLAVWRMRIPFEHGEDYGRLIQDLPSEWLEFPSAALTLLSHGTDWHRWGAFWIVVLASLVFTLVRRRSDESLAAIVLMAGILAPYIVAYTVTDWNLFELAETSANRLLTHLLGPALFIIAAAGWNPDSNRTLA